MDGFGFCVAALLGLKGLSFQEYTLLPHFKKPPKFLTSPKFKICDFELHRTPHLKYAFRTSSTALSELAQKRLSLMRSQSFKNRFNRQKIPQGIFRAPRFSKLTQKKGSAWCVHGRFKLSPSFLHLPFYSSRKGRSRGGSFCKKGRKIPLFLPCPLDFLGALWYHFTVGAVGFPPSRKPSQLTETRAARWANHKGTRAPQTGQKDPAVRLGTLAIDSTIFSKREVQMLLLLSPF